MREKKVLGMVLVFILAITGCAHIANRDVLFQTSTINALLNAVYDGEFTFAELKQHGNFGLGTFNNLAGEMIALDGVFYQIKHDGKVYPVDNAARTPFAAVTFFEPDKTVVIDKEMNYDQLGKYIRDIIPTKNIFYAIKIEGEFNYIKARSVPNQTKPYPLLVDVVKSQPTFEFTQVKGTMVGFYCPAYAKEINVPGYHFHFINSEKNAGGHVLDCRINKVKVEIDYTDKFYVQLPQGNEFYNVDLTQEKKSDLEKVEK